MASEFLKSFKALDDAVNAATNFEALREAALQHMAAAKQIVRSDEGFGQRRIAGEPEPESVAPSASSLPANTAMRRASDTFCRYVVFDNSSFEIFGDSEQDLNDQESRIRAILSRRS